jgi:RNA polymerase sigma-70 factor (ECF subfamily)
MMQAMGSTARQMTSTDDELVARALEGDTRSFDELVLRWERPIYALAFRVLGRDEDARDVCQDTFLRAFRGLGAFKGQAKFSSWLYRIALNLCRDALRRERRTPLVAVPEGAELGDLIAQYPSPAPSVEDMVSRAEMTRHVAAAMRRLPEDQRTAILLKEYHGMTFQEAADVMGCPLSTAKTRMYQGLSVLRRELAASGRGRADVAPFRKVGKQP